MFLFKPITLSLSHNYSVLRQVAYLSNTVSVTNGVSELNKKDCVLGVVDQPDFLSAHTITRDSLLIRIGKKSALCDFE